MRRGGGVRPDPQGCAGRGRLSVYPAVCAFRKASILALAACAHAPPAEISRDLPAVPDKLVTAPPAPALDTQCRFPWYGVKGCKGKDARAMLRLTVSDDKALRQRAGASLAWYETVRRDYGAR